MISDTKVYKVLAELNVYELNRLKKYLVSPYFNKNKFIISYYEVIYDLLKDGKELEVTREFIWGQIYPDKTYSDPKFRKLSADLLKLIESFLAVELFEENPLHKANYLLEMIGDKNIEILYNTAVNTANRTAEKQIERPATYYYHLYQKEKNYFSLSSEFEKKSRSSKLEFNLSDINTNLDKFFIAEKLKYACTLISWKNVMKLDDEIPFIDEIIHHVQTHDYSDTPPIIIYYQIYLTTIEPDDAAHFNKLRSLIDQFIALFPPGEARSIFDSALNYCIRKINQGKIEFIEKAMELYVEGIDNKILLVNEELSPTSFRNACLLALRIGNYNWAEQFVNQYGNLINPKFRENAISFNLARISYYKKDFDKVKEYLREVEFDDLIYNLTSKSILLATYYETEELEPMYALFESFRTYLNRNKSNMPERYYHSYINLIKYTKKLGKTYPKDKKRIDIIRKEIEQQPDIADKKWLLQKLDELEGI